MGKMMDFRPLIDQEMRSVMKIPSTPLFGLEAMTAYHLGFADENGLPLSTSSGKFIRSLFCMAICAGLGGKPEKAVPAATAIELTHRTSLIFDDIQDAGEERNGRPTVWMKWGVDQAINAGLMLSCYARLAAQRSLSEGISPQCTLWILKVLEDAVLGLTKGQSSDISLVDDFKLSIDDYLQMAKGKTGMLFGAAAEIGAICADVDVYFIEHAAEMGQRLGMAFQMLDDYLGIWGEPDQTGKTVNDLVLKKRSLPVVLAMEMRPVEMNAYLSLPKIEPDMAGTIRLWMNDIGVAERTMSMVGDYTGLALAYLADLPLDPDWYQELSGLARNPLNRKQ